MDRFTTWRAAPLHCNWGAWWENTTLYTHTYWGQDQGTGIGKKTAMYVHLKGDKKSRISNDIILFFPYEKMLLWKMEMVMCVTQAEKHQHYEEEDGKWSFARGQKSVQALLQVCRMKRRMAWLRKKWSDCGVISVTEKFYKSAQTLVWEPQAKRLTSGFEISFRDSYR